MRNNAKDQFPLALNVLLNYWEIKPSLYETKLKELALKDVRIVSTFVPWSHLETDIYHSLKKFVRAVHASGLRLRLFVMPELGVHYPNCGFPKELLNTPSNLAADRHGKTVFNCAAPNIFALPSFAAPEVLKRFGNYLIKLGSTLSEAFSEAGTSDFFEIVVTNSLFNYYRNQGLDLFEHGDYSPSHVMAFRDFIDKEYRLHPSPEVHDIHAATNLYGNNEQFKMQTYESFNRHRFFTHVEKLLREKIDLVFIRKNTACVVKHIDLFNPECDSSSQYATLLEELMDYRPSIERYYESLVAGGYRNESIFLSNSGVFRRFTDQEKSFLILASMIHSGELAVSAEDLFELSAGFQRKLNTLVDFIDEKKLVRKRAVNYFSASKFSMEKNSFGWFCEKVPGMLSVITSCEKATTATTLSEKLVFMDPKSIVRLHDVTQLLQLASVGKIVAIPSAMKKVSNYTADAAFYCEKLRKEKKSLKIGIGLEYEIFDYDLGQVVFYDPEVFWTENEEKLNQSKLFLNALVGLSEIEPVCKVSRKDVHVVSYFSAEDPSSRLLFLLNPTEEKIECQIEFASLVSLEGLSKNTEENIVGKHFELVVPPLGVLSVQVSDKGLSSVQEMFEAEATESSGEAWT